MGAMRRNLLFSLAVIAFLSGSAYAAVTTEQTTDPEFLINSGYSQLTAEDVFMQKNRANSKPIEPLYEKNQNKFIKACRQFYAYLDPSIDEVDRIHHDIKPSPSFSDL